MEPASERIPLWTKTPVKYAHVNCHMEATVVCTSMSLILRVTFFEVIVLSCLGFLEGFSVLIFVLFLLLMLER